MDVSRITILVEEGYIPTELALVQDVLRIATRLSADFCFDFSVCTTSADAVIEGKGGILVRAKPFQSCATTRPDHIVVLGGAGVKAAFHDLRARLSSMERLGVRITLLSDAAAEWKRLHRDVDQFTTHWELQQLDRDAGLVPSNGLPLFSQKARVTTGAGMAASADIVLTQIVAPQSLRLAQSVAQVLLIGDIRDGSIDQPRSENDVMALRHSKLEPAIAEMENAIETPLSIAEIAEIAGFSVRQMERKFKASFGQSPAAFYRSLRLRRAKTMVEQTILPISEISIATGFGSVSHFSKKYTLEFGVSPSKRRSQLSTNLHPTPLSTVPQGSQNAPQPVSPLSTPPLKAVARTLQASS